MNLYPHWTNNNSRENRFLRFADGFERPKIQSNRQESTPDNPEISKDKLQRELTNEISSVLHQEGRTDKSAVQKAVASALTIEQERNGNIVIKIDDGALKQAGLNPFSLQILKNDDVGFSGTFGGIEKKCRNEQEVRNVIRALSKYSHQLPAEPVAFGKAP